MRHYGFEPPWTNRDSRYGWWKNVGESWEGGWVWELQPPLSLMENLGRMLDLYYLQVAKNQLNQEVLLRELAERPA